MRAAYRGSRLAFALILANMVIVRSVAVAADVEARATAAGAAAVVQTHVEQGHAWRALGRLDLAARAFEAAVEAGGDDPHMYQALGEVLMQLDQCERGAAFLDLADYTRASRRDPDQIVYDFNRGVVWLQLDQFERIRRGVGRGRLRSSMPCCPAPRWLIPP